MKIFTNGKTYISPDVDSHNGGAWKAAKSVKKLGSKKTRLGTYDAGLERIGD
jgi:filamentous hemagglutinin